MPEPLVVANAIVPAVLAVVNIVMERRMDARDAAHERGELPRPAILELTVSGAGSNVQRRAAPEGRRYQRFWMPAMN